MKAKRCRSVNWDEEEKLLFRSVLKDYIHIIEDKSLDTNTNKNKAIAWEEVHKKFNALNFRHRELGQLKIQWKCMKINARKTCGSYRGEIMKVLDDADLLTPDESIIQIKYMLNPAELLRDENPLDSDGPILKPDTEVEAPASVAASDFQEHAQNSDHTENVTKVTDRKVPKRKLLFRNDMDKIANLTKEHYYVNKLLIRSKKLKEEEHRRRMQMAVEEHEIKMLIHKEKLRCTVLEREILEIRKAHEVNLN